MPFVVESHRYRRWVKCGNTWWGAQREVEGHHGHRLHFVNRRKTKGLIIGALTPSELSLDARRLRFFSQKDFSANQMVVDLSREQFWELLLPWANKRKVRWSARPLDLFDRREPFRGGIGYGVTEYKNGNYYFTGVPSYRERTKWVVSFETSEDAVLFYMLHSEELMVHQ